MKNKLILIFIGCFFLTGCWNYNELNDYAIVTGLGIDKIDDKYEVSMLVANGEGSNTASKSGSAQTAILKAKDRTISGALEKLNRQCSKTIYLGHMQLLLVNEDVVKENMYEVVDNLFRNPESIKKYSIAIIRNNRASQALSVTTSINKSASSNITTNLENTSGTLSNVYNVLLSDFIYNNMNKGIEPVLPTIVIEGKVSKSDSYDDLDNIDSKTNIKLDTMAIFNKYKFVGYADEKESKGIGILNNKISSVIIKNKCGKDKYVITQLDDIKSKIKVKDKKKIKIDIKAEGSINELNCNMNLNDQKDVDKINKMASETLYNIVNKALIKAGTLKSDIYGFGNMYYKKYGVIDDDWNNNLKDIEFDINTNISLKTKGSLTNNLMEESK